MDIMKLPFNKLYNPGKFWKTKTSKEFFTAMANTVIDICVKNKFEINNHSECASQN